MTKIKGYSYRKDGKLVQVPAHDRRTYKGYRHHRQGKPVKSPSRAFKQDRKKTEFVKSPRKNWKPHLSHQGDW